MEFYHKKLNELKDIEKKRELTNEEFFIFCRIEKFLQASELKLKYFRYAGGIYENSLEFCKARNNKIFSIEEMRSWKNAPDKPHIENYDLILHLGGNKCFKGEKFCNHGLNFISFEKAKRERPNIKVDEVIHIDLSNQLNPEILELILKKKNELLLGSSNIKTSLINGFFQKFINDMVTEKGKITHEGKDISLEDALEMISKLIKNTII